MPETIAYTSCPVCFSEAIYPALSAKDYTVSGEVFEIWHCEDCTARFTQQIPSADNIGPYYQSAAYVSHSDTNKGFINRLYHLVRNYTLKSKRNFLQKLTGKSKASLLDIGAGTGAFADTMHKAGWNTIALEPDENARTIALKNYGIELLPTENLFQLTNSSFDAITLWHVLEHIHLLQGYMQEFQRILKKDGVLVIAVPNYTSYDASVYKECWAAYDVPRHLYHFSPKSIEILAQKHGFSLQSIKPMWFDSFYVSMLSEQYRNGSANLIGALWNGCISNSKALLNNKKGSSVIYVLRKLN